MPYHPFPTGQTSLYEIGIPAPIYTSYCATRIDSVRPDGADSLYYLYRTIRRLNQMDTLVDCQGGILIYHLPMPVLTNDDHRLGKFMRLKPNGDCEFVYSTGDTFLLRTQATTGQSWTWEPGVTATVNTVVYESVLSQMDSVKYISLSNGQMLKLSRNFGLVRAFPFNSIPDIWGQPDTTSIYLWGIPSLGMGAHLPTFEERYQHQHGDEWVHTFYKGNLAAPSYGSGTMYHTRILSEIPGTHYQYLALMESMHYAMTPAIYYGPGVNTVIDTIGWDSTAFDPLRHLLPQEWNPACECGRLGDWRNPQFNGRLQTEVVAATGLDSCSQVYVSAFGQTFVDGVGGSIWEYNYDGGDVQRKVLNCFVHGTETWGTCPDFHALSLPEVAASSDWTFWPNPARDRVHVQATAGTEDREFDLITVEGRTLRHVLLPAGSADCEIGLDGLAQGLYWLREVGGRGQAIVLCR